MDGRDRDHHEQTLRALRESERAHATLLANLPGVAYHCLNVAGWPMQFMSEGCLELTGHPPEVFLPGGRLSFGDIIHPDDRGWVWDEVQRAVQEDRRFTLEYRILRADGEERVVWERGTAIRDASGRVKSLEGFIWDVSERVELERRSLHAQKMELLGAFAGGVAHDFNNLLMVIRAFLELASDAVLDDSLSGWARRAERAVDRAASLTRQLIAFSRRQPLERTKLDLRAVVEGHLEMIGHLLGHRVHVELELGSEPAWVYADAGQLEQVLLNLCVNARDAMPEGGTLRIRCDSHIPPSNGPEGAASWSLLEVADSGGGMPPEVLERALTPFFTTKEEGEGTGLGLASVQRIVERHGGRLALDSVLGQGTTVRLELPGRIPQPAE